MSVLAAAFYVRSWSLSEEFALMVTPLPVSYSRFIGSDEDPRKLPDAIELTYRKRRR